MISKQLLTMTILACLSTFGNCDPGDSTLTSTKSNAFDVAISLEPNQTRITNGQSSTYNATITLTRRGNNDAVSGVFELIGSAEERPLIAAWNGTLAKANVNIPAGQNTQTLTFTLTCSAGGDPAGTAGTLSGGERDSGRGGRVCKGGCPPNCGTRGNLPCPAGCSRAPVVCTDDPVTIAGRFGNTTSPGISILCMPSVGPTQGSL